MRANEQTYERVAQYLRLDSWLRPRLPFFPAVIDLAAAPLSPAPTLCGAWIVLSGGRTPRSLPRRLISVFFRIRLDMGDLLATAPAAAATAPTAAAAISGAEGESLSELRRRPGRGEGEFRPREAKSRWVETE